MQRRLLHGNSCCKFLVFAGHLVRANWAIFSRSPSKFGHLWAIWGECKNERTNNWALIDLVFEVVIVAFQFCEPLRVRKRCSLIWRTLFAFWCNLVNTEKFLSSFLTNKRVRKSLHCCNVNFGEVFVVEFLGY